MRQEESRLESLTSPAHPVCSSSVGVGVGDLHHVQLPESFRPRTVIISFFLFSSSGKEYVVRPSQEGDMDKEIRLVVAFLSSPPPQPPQKKTNGHGPASASHSFSRLAVVRCNVEIDTTLVEGSEG